MRGKKFRKKFERKFSGMYSSADDAKALYKRAGAMRDNNHRTVIDQTAHPYLMCKYKTIMRRVGSLFKDDFKWADYGAWYFVPVDSESQALAEVVCQTFEKAKPKGAGTQCKVVNGADELKEKLMPGRLSKEASKAKTVVSVVGWTNFDGEIDKFIKETWLGSEKERGDIKVEIFTLIERGDSSFYIESDHDRDDDIEVNYATLVPDFITPCNDFIIDYDACEPNESFDDTAVTELSEDGLLHEVLGTVMYSPHKIDINIITAGVEHYMEGIELCEKLTSVGGIGKVRIQSLTDKPIFCGNTGCFKSKAMLSAGDYRWFGYNLGEFIENDRVQLYITVAPEKDAKILAVELCDLLKVAYSKMIACRCEDKEK